MMKNLIKLLLQKALGFDNYLFCFAIIKVCTMRWDRQEGVDFYHFMNLLPNRGVVLDIGANIGVMTTLLARRLDNAVIYAFEPIPDNFQALRGVVNAFKLPNVALYQLALGDARRRVSMSMPVVGGIKMQGASFVMVDDDAAQTGTKYVVDMDKLDCIKELAHEEIVGIKVDVEGYESPVIRGGANLIKKQRPVIYAELWDSDSKRDSLEVLESIGYTAMVLDRLHRRLIPYDPGKHNVLNYFFVP